MRLPHKLVAIDIETTGLFPEAGADIVQIGAVIVNEDLSMGNTFKSYVKPKSEYRDAKAMQINGISEATLAEAPELEEAMDKLWRFAINGTCTTQPSLAAWGPTFDFSFIMAVCHKYGIEARYNFRPIDLKTIAWWEFAHMGTTSNGVAGYLKKVGLEFEGEKHDALSDIVNTVRLIQAVSKRV